MVFPSAYYFLYYGAFSVLLPFLAKTEKDRRHLLLREGFKSLLDDGARFAARLTVPEVTE